MRRPPARAIGLVLTYVLFDAICICLVVFLVKSVRDREYLHRELKIFIQRSYFIATLLAIMIPLTTILLILVATGRLRIGVPWGQPVRDEEIVENIEHSDDPPKYDEINNYDLVENPPSYQSLNGKALPGHISV